jgi:hypothetical protein
MRSEELRLEHVLGLLDCGMSFIPFASSATCLLFAEGYGTTRSGIDCMLGDGIDCGASIGFNFLGAAACLVRGVPALGSIVACTGAGFSIVKNCAECGGGSGPGSFSGSSGRVELNSVHPAAALLLGSAQPQIGSTVAQWQQAQARLQAHVDFLQGYADVVNVSRIERVTSAPNTFHHAAYFEPKTLTYGTISFLSRDSGASRPFLRCLRR